MTIRSQDIDLLDYRSPILIAALEELRGRHGWSKKELAERAGFFPSVLNEWFQNRSVPNIDTLEKLCAGCGVTLDELWRTGREIVEERRRLVALEEALEGVDPEIVERVKQVLESF